jgi:hypothetical protein
MGERWLLLRAVGTSPLLLRAAGVGGRTSGNEAWMSAAECMVGPPPSGGCRQQQRVAGGRVAACEERVAVGGWAAVVAAGGGGSRLGAVACK